MVLEKTPFYENDELGYVSKVETIMTRFVIYIKKNKKEKGEMF